MFERLSMIYEKMTNKNDQFKRNKKESKVEALMLNTKEVKDRILNIYLVFLAFVVPVLEAFSVSRAFAFGWKNIFYLHIFASLFLILFAVFRNSIPISVKVSSMIVIVFAAGCAGILEFGIIGNGLMIFSLVAIFSTVFMGFKSGIICIILSSLYTFGVWVLFKNGIINYTFNIQNYFNADSSWFTALGMFLLLVSGIVIVIGILLKSLNMSNDALFNKLKDLSLKHKENEELILFEKLISKIQNLFIYIQIDKIDEAIEKALECIGQEFEIDRIGLWQVSDDKNYFNFTHFWAADGINVPSSTISSDRFPFLKNIILDKKSPFVFSSVNDLPQEASIEKSYYINENIKSAIILPLEIDEKIIGAISASMLNKERVWPQKIIERLILISQIISSGIKHKQTLADRQKAEETIRESEERFRSLIDQSPFAIEILTPDGRITRKNPAWTRLWGISEEDSERVVEKYNMLEDDRLVESGVMQQVKKAFSGEAVTLPAFKYDSTLTIDDLDITISKPRKPWIQSHLYPLRDSKGKIKYMINMYKDITELKTAEEDLKVSEEKYRTLFESSADGILILDPEAGYIDCNSAALKLFGVSSKEELLKLNPIKLSPEYQPDGSSSVVLAKENIEKALEEGSYYFEWMHKRVDGHDFPANVLATRIKWKDKILLQGTIRDITERKLQIKKLEEANRFNEIIMANSDIGMGIYKDSGQCISANIAIANLVGASLEEVKKQNFRNIESWKKSGLLALAEETLATGVENNMNIHVISSFGKEVWLECNVKRLSIDGMYHLFLIISDISQREKAAKEKDEMQRQIFHSSRLASIGELAAGVGHEINNPLAIIKGNLDLLEETAEGNNLDIDKVFHRIDKMNKATGRILKIVQGLRLFSRSDEDKIENIDIGAVIDDFLSLTGIILEKDNVRVHVNHKAKKCEIAGNSGKFQQILMNLISNAKDAMEGLHEKKIMIETDEIDDWVSMKVTDIGCGIDEDKLDRIFDPFYTSKEIGKGTGLGLGITKSIIENMGGRIDVKSIVDEGTTFTLSFPKFTYQPSANELKKKAGYKMLSGSAIIVDDEEDIRELLGNYIEGFGIDVDMACDGFEAIDKIKLKKFDYIITDLKMPKMSGEELISEIRKLDLANMKIFIITGAIDMNEDFLVKLKHDYFIDGCIEKPFSKDEIYYLLSKK